MSEVKLEVCVDDASGLQAAIQGGADRIELCSALSVGGLTPSKGFMTHAAAVRVPVFAMIRPRAGDFVFNQDEIDLMRADIDAARAAGLSGVVLGASLSNNQLDAKTLEALFRHAEGLGKTLHRAIDLVPNLDEAVDIAIDIGFARILTSGGKRTVTAGVDNLVKMHERANGRISIMAGSGISATTAKSILSHVRLDEVHASCAISVETPPSILTDYGFIAPSTRHATAASVKAIKDVLRSC